MRIFHPHVNYQLSVTICDAIWRAVSDCIQTRQGVLQSMAEVYYPQEDGRDVHSEYLQHRPEIQRLNNHQPQTQPCPNMTDNSKIIKDKVTGLAMLLWV